MKNLVLVLKRSKLISIFWGSSIFILLNILFWVIGWESLSFLDFTFDPIFGGFIGYLGWKISQINDQDKKETRNKI